MFRSVYVLLLALVCLGHSRRNIEEEFYELKNIKKKFSENRLSHSEIRKETHSRYEIVQSILKNSIFETGLNRNDYHEEILENMLSQELLENFAEISPKMEKKVNLENCLTDVTVGYHPDIKFKKYENVEIFARCKIGDGEEILQIVTPPHYFRKINPHVVGKKRMSYSGYKLDGFLIVDVEETIKKHPQRNVFTYRAPENERRKIEAYNTMGLDKSLIVVRAGFTDNQNCYTDAEIRNHLEGFLWAWYPDTSYGLLAYNRLNITPIVVLNSTIGENAGNYRNAGSQARIQARDALGYDYTDYTFWIVSFPKGQSSVCSGIARGSVGNAGAWFCTNNRFTYPHEMGHNMGMWHSNSLSPSATGSFGGAQSHSEYGDWPSVMGSYEWFNLPHRHIILGWVNDNVEVIEANVIQNGFYEIYNYDHHYALGKPLGYKFRWNQNDDYFWYYVSFRETENSYWHRNVAMDLHMTYATYWDNGTHFLDSTRDITGNNQPIMTGAALVEVDAVPELRIFAFGKACPDDKVLTPCKFKFYVHRGAPAVSGDITTNVKNIFDELVPGYTQFYTNSYAMYFFDVNNADVINYWVTLNTATMVSNTLYTRSPFYLSRQSNSAYDLRLEVSEYLNGRTTVEKIQKTVTGTFNGSPVGQQVTDQGRQLRVRSYASSSVNSIMSFQNDLLLSKEDNVDEMIIYTNNLPGLSSFRTAAYDGTTVISTAFYESYSNNLAFALNVKRTKTELEFGFHPPRTGDELYQLIQFVNVQNSKEIEFDDDYSLRLLKKFTFNYRYFIKLHQNSTLAFEFYDSELEDKVSISLGFGSTINMKHTFVLTGKNDDANEDYKVETNEITQLKTVEIPVGRIFSQNYHPLNYLYFKFIKEKKKGVAIFKNIRIYDKIDDLKDKISSSSVENSIVEYDPALFTYHWNWSSNSNNTKNIFKSVNNNQIIVDAVEVAKQPYNITLIVKAADSTILLEETFDANYQIAVSKKKKNLLLLWLGLSIGGVFLALCICLCIVLFVVVLSVILFVVIKNRKSDDYDKVDERGKELEDNPPERNYPPSRPTGGYNKPRKRVPKPPGKRVPKPPGGGYRNYNY